ncbi:hypothetical protein C8P70_12726 [Myroides indicus]|uniref:Uncharacterized protein n=1 Tax=Myroides indicus TaxID=1323422 RepID=A0A4R7EUU4_9FLAO|nr:hypothetical protein C8P70_12726 [Myroides indicus]
MLYPFISVGLVVVFVLYTLYVLLVKKDMKKFKTIFYPGLFFIAVWGAIYCFLLR